VQKPLSFCCRTSASPCSGGFCPLATSTFRTREHDSSLPDLRSRRAARTSRRICTVIVCGAPEHTLYQHAIALIESLIALQSLPRIQVEAVRMPSTLKPRPAGGLRRHPWDQPVMELTRLRTRPNKPTERDICVTSASWVAAFADRISPPKGENPAAPVIWVPERLSGCATYLDASLGPRAVLCVT
jgi:hypothetical protein